tara:strand:+ start:965 stop:1726 length:762 start_codon:yes stop_codon:yes gene_type:complete
MDDCLVAIFDVDEITTPLAKLCYEKLGFKNVLILSGEDGFSDKFLRFAKIASNSDYQYFVRSDSDRLPFDGMKDLVASFKQHCPDIDNVEGYGFDYFMNKFRGATPQVYSRRCLVRLDEDNSLIANVPKPENYFGKKSKLKFSSQKIFTNLHDFSQRPSKACNAFVNRMIRDGLKHYNMDHLNALPEHYKRSFMHAYDLMKSGRLVKKENMDYWDFSFLDEGFEDKVNTDLEKSYYNHKKIYDGLTVKFKNQY